MKFNKVITPAALFLLLGTGASVYGQHEEQGKSEKSQARPQPQQHAQQPKPKQPEQKVQPRQQQQRAAQPKPAAQAKQQQAQRAEQPKPAAQPRQQAQRVQQPKPASAATPTAGPAGPAIQAGSAGQTTNSTAATCRGREAHTFPEARTECASCPEKQARRTEDQLHSSPANPSTGTNLAKQSSWRTDGAWQETRPGSRIARQTGKPITAPGRSAAATAATTFHKPASV